MTPASSPDTAGRAMAAAPAASHASWDPEKENVMARLSFPVTLLCGAAITVTVFALMQLVPPAPNLAAAAIGSSVQVRGVSYTSPGARPLDPRNRHDAALMRGAPRARGRRRIWFGTFLLATNHGTRPAAMARRIVLRDESGHTYRPVALPAGNRYRYRPRTLAAGAQAPGPRSPAQSDLAAGGALLLYRIPRSAYEEGPLEVAVGAAHADLRVSDGGGAHLSSAPRTTPTSTAR
jgi:hypothetical protein